MFNPGLGASASLASLGRYAVIAGAAASVIARSGVLLPSREWRVDRMVLITILLGMFLCLHGLLFSRIPDVSIFKALSWTAATATLISAWAGLNSAERALVERRLFAGLILLMTLSLPFLASGTGYLRNGSGFQGVLNHPQAFGPTMALLAAWAAARMLTSVRPKPTTVGLLGSCLVLVVLSEARTAGVAFGLAVVLAAVCLRVLTGKPTSVLFPAVLSRRFHLTIILLVIGLIAAAPKLADVMAGYISKRGDSTNVMEAYERSRGRLMEQMLMNIRDQPLVGIGFGIGSDPSEMDVERDPVLGLPVSAAIEKGVLPLAVLEELGLLGAWSVLVWLWLLIRRAVRGFNMVPLALLFTSLLLNMGEMMLFSPGGMGLLILVVVGLAASERHGTPQRAEVSRG